MSVIDTLFPHWTTLDIHESSPARRGASLKIAQHCLSYTKSQYDPSIPFGQVHPSGYISQDLQAQTFTNESFDLVITQDVFEHLLRPDLAIKEIARTLRPNGAHIMTVPIVRKNASSRRRAALNGASIEHLLPPEYHGNPMSDEGSLVTIDWGYDIAEFLCHHSDLPTSIHHIEDREAGILGEYLEVVVTRKVLLPIL